MLLVNDKYRLRMPNNKVVIVKILLILTIFLCSSFYLYSQENGIFTDKRDGKTYKWVKIGTQTWMAENLACKPVKGGYWAYNNDLSFVSKNGYLYDWRIAIQVCPSVEGWHLPSDKEWNTLTDYLGGDKLAGGKLKNTTYWFTPNNGADNSSGFTALPGGWRRDNVTFQDYFDSGKGGYWWSSTEKSSTSAWSRSIIYNFSYFCRATNSKLNGLSVRCLKNN
jgi:uncharacterized protein (TIGR02145 family)